MTPCHCCFGTLSLAACPEEPLFSSRTERTTCCANTEIKFGHKSSQTVKALCSCVKSNPEIWNQSKISEKASTTATHDGRQQHNSGQSDCRELCGWHRGGFSAFQRSERGKLVISSCRRCLLFCKKEVQAKVEASVFFQQKDEYRKKANCIAYLDMKHKQVTNIVLKRHPSPK